MIDVKKHLIDRLNHLKSVYSQETNVKLTKTVNSDFVRELSIRIDELEQLKDKL